MAVGTASEILATLATSNPELAAAFVLVSADQWIELAAVQMSASAWGSGYQQALAYLAAHMATVATNTSGENSGTASGPLTSKRAGDVAVSFGDISGKASNLTDAILSSTVYGRAYLQLRSTRSATMARMIRVNT